MNLDSVVEPRPLCSGVCKARSVLTMSAIALPKAAVHLSASNFCTLTVALLFMTANASESQPGNPPTDVDDKFCGISIFTIGLFGRFVVV